MTHRPRTDPDPGPLPQGPLTSRSGRAPFPLLPLAIGLAGAFAYVLVLQWRNPRLIPSWHGFLHTAIANRFPSPGLVPENPFFAGEPLPYYWVYHRLGAWVASAAGIDPLSALRWLTLAGLALLVVTAVLLGARVFRSGWAGLLVLVLALVGLNPLGPGLALGRQVARGAVLLEEEAGAPAVETLYTSNETADALMSHNLLGRLYFSTDWRHGNNVVWFFDISSRGLALAMVLVLVAALVRERWSAGALLAMALAAWFLAALNPIVGLAVIALLCGWLLLLGRRQGLLPALAMGAGLLLAVPTFMHLFAQGGGGTSINPPGLIAMKLVNLGFNFILVLPLALLALRTREGETTLPFRAVVATGIVLLLAAVTVHLEEGNEHNLANAAQVILAVPAVAGLARRGEWSPRPRTIAIVVALVLPMAAALWIAFDRRPPLPFQASGGALVRLPESEPLPRAYAWIREETPSDAIIVTDPRHPVKMSGNVSELPAFTGRTLFVDHASYLTTPYPDVERRWALAERLAGGEAPGAEEAAYLQDVSRSGEDGPRQLYIMTLQANLPEVRQRFQQGYGPPRFAAGFVALYELTLSGPAEATP